MIIHEVDLGPARRVALRQAGASPVRIFGLEELEIDKEEALERLAPSFTGLPFDPYDPALKAERLVRSQSPALYFASEMEWLRVWNNLGNNDGVTGSEGPEFWLRRSKDASLRRILETLKPYRRRSCFQFTAFQRGSGHTWRLKEEGCPVFAQAVTDVRSRPRQFHCTPIEVYRDPVILRIIAFACQLVSQAAALPTGRIRVTLHQILTYAIPKLGGEPAPEGRHQDGSDFIVSALVVERNNVTGGVSYVYYDERGHVAISPRELQPGEGILQADMYRNLWHEVSSISPKLEDREAYRSIVGLDLDFLGGLAVPLFW